MSYEPANRLFVFNSNTEIKASSLNYNFNFLYDYLSGISTDTALISSLASSTNLADLVANAMLEVDSTFISSIATELSSQSSFYEDLVNQINIDPSFFTLLVNTMEQDSQFLSNLSYYLNESTDFVNNISNSLAEDTRGVNTRTDISGYTSSIGGTISYLATDSGTLRTKKSDAISTAASDYSSNSAYDVDGSFWAIEVNPDGNTYSVYRYDTESDYNTYHPAMKDEYLAGKEGTVGEIYKSIQFIDTTSCIDKTDGHPDRTTGRIYEYEYSAWTEDTVLPTGYEKVYTISLRVLTASPSETFTFQTYNINVSDNGFVTNVAHAMVTNDNLTHEIAEKVVENPSFVTELSQNIQKVRIGITTETIGAGSTSGNYHDDVTNTDESSGTVIDDYTVRYDLTPRRSIDASGNYSIIAEPWVIGQVRVMPYLNTSGADIDIVGVGIDVSGGCYLDLESTPSAGIGNAISTRSETAKSVAYIRGKSGERLYLANENNALSITSSWSNLGWTAPTSGNTARFLDTLDNDCNFNTKIYRTANYGETSYEATDNIYPLDDLRNFWYYGDTKESMFLEIKNNLGSGLGNTNKYVVDIYGYRLIDSDIVLTPGLYPHDHGYDDISSSVDGVTSVFQLSHDFILNSTRIFQQYVPLQRGQSGDLAYGNDYYEIQTSGNYGRYIAFYVPPSNGEWIQCDYERGLS